VQSRCRVHSISAVHSCTSRQQDRHHYHTAPFSTEHCCCCRLHHQTGVCCQTLIWRAHLWSSSSRLRHSGRWVVTLQPETLLCLGRLLVVYKQYKQGSNAEESIGCNYHAVKLHDVDFNFCAIATGIASRCFDQQCASRGCIAPTTTMLLLIQITPCPSTACC
jgi:hypothetical protein